MFENLSKAPVREVIIGVAIKIDPKNLNNTGFLDDIQKIYPQKRLSKSVQFTPPILQAKEEFEGYNFASSDNNKVAVFDRNRVALHIKHTHKNYENFSVLLKEFITLLNTLKKYGIFFSINGDIGLRYINIFRLLEEDIDLFKINLLVGKEKENIHSFESAFKVVVSSEEINSIVRVVKNNVEPDSTQIRFDIDSHINTKAIEPNIDEITKYLLKLRDIKNNIFFNNIDDRLVTRWK